MGYQDLHIHTTLSDGQMSYQQVLDLAQKNNIDVVAFTDHDLVPPEKNLRILNQLRQHPVKWIVGVEMSSAPPKEREEVTISQFHIVGLFVDPKDRDLIQQGRRIVEARIERMKKLVKNIKQLGFTLREDDCLAESRGEVVQRPHIVAALLKKRKNIELIKKMIMDLKVKAKVDLRAKRFYRQIKKRMEANPDDPYRQSVYKLFLDDQAYIKGVYLPKKGVLDFDRTVKLIRNAGGIAILAHWSEYRHQFPLEWVEKVFREGRIDGAEIVYDFYRIKLGEEEELRKEQRAIKELVRKYGLLASAGSDVHLPEELGQICQNEYYARQTIGLAEEMIRKKKVFLGWSTLKTKN